MSRLSTALLLGALSAGRAARDSNSHLLLAVDEAESSAHAEGPGGCYDEDELKTKLKDGYVVPENSWYLAVSKQSGQYSGADYGGCIQWELIGASQKSETENDPRDQCRLGSPHQVSKLLVLDQPTPEGDQTDGVGTMALITAEMAESGLTYLIEKYENGDPERQVSPADLADLNSWNAPPTQVSIENAVGWGATAGGEFWTRVTAWKNADKETMGQVNFGKFGIVPLGGHFGPQNGEKVEVEFMIWRESGSGESGSGSWRIHVHDEPGSALDLEVLEREGEEAFFDAKVFDVKAHRREHFLGYLAEIRKVNNWSDTSTDPSPRFEVLGKPGADMGQLLCLTYVMGAWEDTQKAGKQ